MILSPRTVLLIGILIQATLISDCYLFENHLTNKQLRPQPPSKQQFLQIFESCYFQLISSIQNDTFIITSLNTFYNPVILSYPSNITQPKWAIKKVKYFNQCLVQLYMMDSLFPVPDIPKIVLESIGKTWMADISPNYIIFNGLNCEKDNGYYTTLYHHSIVTIFLQVYIKEEIDDLMSAAIICVHCFSVPGLKATLPLSMVHNKTGLQSLWKNIHSNMLSTQIDNFVFVRERAFFYSNPAKRCSSLANYVPWPMCTIHFLSQKYNFSLRGPSKEYAPLITGQFHYYFQFGNMLYDELVKPKKKIRFMWLGYGERFEEFAYAIIVDKNILRFRNLWKPFDVITWSAILTSVLVLAFTSSLSLKRFSFTKFVLRIIENFMNCVYILLEQGVSLNTFSDSGKVVRILIPIWLTMSLILGTAYKGLVVSYLTGDLQPIFPSSIQEILDLAENRDDFVIGTCRRIVGSTSKYRIESSLVDGILKHLINENRSVSLAQQLQRKTVHFEADVQELELFAKPGNQVPIIVDNQYMDITIMVPMAQYLVVLDYKDDIRALTKYLAHSKRVFAGFGTEKSSIFQIRYPWLLTRNTFGPIIGTSFARLVESGIPAFLGGVSRSKLGGYNVGKLNFIKRRRNATDDYVGSDPDPLNIHSVKSILLICTLLQSLGFIIWIIEIFGFKKKKDEVIFG